MIHRYSLLNSIRRRAIIGSRAIFVALSLLLAAGAGAMAQSYVKVPKCIDVKTNAAAWALLAGNAAVEFHFSDRWSLNIPVYFGACNYFHSDVKFRMLGIMPEARVHWSAGERARMFAGLHFGLSSYNMALGGKYRYQDHDGDNPAAGFGLSLGLRHDIGHSGHWFMEYSLGAGYYHLYYDKWENVPGGALAGSRQRWKPIVDVVAVTFGYRFNNR